MGQTTDPSDRGFQIADCEMWSSGRHMAFYPVHWHKLNQINRAPNLLFYTLLQHSNSAVVAERCYPAFAAEATSAEWTGEVVRSCFKTPSKAQWLRCRPPVNAHILHVYCAFPIGLRLALEPDLRF